MKAVVFIALVSLSCLVLVSPSTTSQRDAHTEWIAKGLKEMQGIKVGMTRAELSKVFTTEGGISARTQQRFVYRECAYIKVDVEFEALVNRKIGRFGPRRTRLQKYRSLSWNGRLVIERPAYLGHGGK